MNNANDGVKATILNKFKELTAVFGMKKITIDKLAKECKISKKTVYKYFKSKDEIVNEFADNITKTLQKEFDKIQLLEDNPKIIIYKFFEIIFGVIRNFPTSIIEDARRFYPDVEIKINKLREEYNILFIKTIKNGIKQGVFKNINPLFIEGFYVGAADKVFNPDWILENNIKIEEIITSFQTMLFSGLLNDNKV